MRHHLISQQLSLNPKPCRRGASPTTPASEPLPSRLPTGRCQESMCGVAPRLPWAQGFDGLGPKAWSAVFPSCAGIGRLRCLPGCVSRWSQPISHMRGARCERSLGPFCTVSCVASFDRVCPCFARVCPCLPSGLMGRRNACSVNLMSVPSRDSHGSVIGTTPLGSRPSCLRSVFSVYDTEP